MKVFHCQLLMLFIAATMFSCNDLEDDYATNPNLRLSFSVDTLSFDTVFTTVGTATRQFMVYNPNKDALNISSIQLTNGDQSCFRFNVDGRSGHAFSDIYILGKDSMYVFVEATVDPTGQNEPLRVENNMEFTVNGTRQTVLLQAYGQDANMIKGGYTFDKDTTLSARRPYLIYDSVVIANGATVTVEPGASFYMHDKAKWVVHGTLNASGTLDKPITFRGDRVDEILTDVPFDHMSGLWDGMYFTKESFGNVMDHVCIRNATEGAVFEESTSDRMKLAISNSQITNSSNNLFIATNCHIEALNTEFSNARNGVVVLNGGHYHFIHCTLVNYYTFKARAGLPTLVLSDTHPLALATFDNCIIDGNWSEGSSELGGEISIDPAKGNELNFLFNHCAIKTKQTENEHFTNVQFLHNDRLMEYRSIANQANNYLNDFRIIPSIDYNEKQLENQPAIGKADKDVAGKYPTDRFGMSRTTDDNGPDIGAYEYVAEKEKD